MKIKKNLFIAICIFAFSFAAFGQTPNKQLSLYGMHFLNFGQSLRVSVQNPKFSDSEIIPCVRVRIVIDIYDNSTTEANRLRLVRRVAREVLLDAGEAVSFDIPATRSGDFMSAAIFARPASDFPADSIIHLASTVSVRESGRTILNLPAVEKGFDPQPDPPAPSAN